MNLTIIEVVLIQLLMLMSQIIEQLPKTSQSPWNVKHHSNNLPTSIVQ